MLLAFHFRLPILVLALASPGCSPKDPGGGDTDTGEPPADTGSSDGSATADGSATTDDPTVAQECTPGDTRPSSAGDCELCVCSDAGVWLCDRCAPTTGPDETTFDDSTASATASSVVSATETGDETTAGTTDTGDDTGDTTGGGALPECAALGDGDPFEIQKAAVMGDELVLEVVYGGGCETHDFTLCFAGIVLDTNVVLVDVVHDAHGDACEALITEPRVFDLTPFQAAGTSPMQLGLDGWGDLLEYTF